MFLKALKTIILCPWKHINYTLRDQPAKYGHNESYKIMARKLHEQLICIAKRKGFIKKILFLRRQNINKLLVHLPL